MNTPIRSLTFVARLLPVAVVCMAAMSSYRDSIEKWRRERAASLVADDGWTTVAGLYWLREGANSFGTDAGGAIVLPAGSAPARCGVFEHRAGKTVLRVAPGVTVLAAGRPVRELEMRSDLAGPPTAVTIADLTLFVIARGDRFAIRLRDKNSAYRKQFRGLEWYPVEERYRIEADFVAWPSPKTLMVPTILDFSEKMTSPGYVTFDLGGREWRLEPVLSGARLFFIFRDRTSGKQTYPAGRFLYTGMPKDGKVLLDFNQAHNPPCAYTPYATCPLPPPQNRLEAAIEAGELNYHH